MSEKVKARMTSPGPKKTLSCDGGGILGLISVEILAKLGEDASTVQRSDSLVQSLICMYQREFT